MVSYTATASGGNVMDSPENGLVIFSGCVPTTQAKGNLILLIFFPLN
jgi:peptide subunit release factor 1 (eRF1)